MGMQVINPATGELVHTYEEFSQAEVERSLHAAHEAFLLWRETEFAHRSLLMHEAATVLRRNQELFARLMATEMGKPVSQGKGEVEKCAWACEYFADEAPRFLAPEVIPADFPNSYVAFQPLGLVLGVMPWNFPFWQVFRAAAPALMAGNGFILKHASNVPGCATAIEQVFRKAGFPEGLFRALLVGSSGVGELIESPFIHGVTVTGSSAAGASVAAKAGSMLKKTVLELGGNDPYVVLEDADLEPTVETCVTARLINSGQSCIAAKRFIVVKGIRQRFEELFVEKMKSRKVGDPMDSETAVGPLARLDLRAALHKQVEESVTRGAKLVLGGEVPSGPGAFYPATVLTNVRKGMPAYEEETFGPVAAIIEVQDEEEAIRVANDSCFGLGAAVFTRDRARGEKVARSLEVGCCFVNEYVRSDPRLPFGGVKASGYGRELSVYGLREFVNIKTICVK